MFQNLGENLRMLTNCYKTESDYFSHLPNMYMDQSAYSQRIQLDFFLADQDLHSLSNYTFCQITDEFMYCCMVCGFINMRLTYFPLLKTMCGSRKFCQRGSNFDGFFAFVF